MSSNPERRPLLRTLIDWFRPSAYERDLTLLEQSRGEEMELFRAHVRGRPEDLRWLAGRDPRSTELLPHMLAVNDIDERRVGRRSMRQMESNCACCIAKLHCADEIGHGRAPGNFEQYCPNAEAMKRLQP